MLWKLLAATCVLLGIGFGVARQVSTPVVVRRDLPAPVAKVWPIFTQTEGLAQWWGPKDYTAAISRQDFRVGGEFLWGMYSPKGDVFYNAGTFTHILQQRRFDATMGFADADGNLLKGADVPVPGKWPDHIKLQILFVPQGKTTQVVVIETGVPLLMSFFTKMGWQQSFDKVEKILHPG